MNTIKNTSLIIFLCLFNHCAKGQVITQNLNKHFKSNILRIDSVNLKKGFTGPYMKTFEAEKLPLFCRTEYKWSKLSGINVRMRLGSLDYVNKLEGK